MATDLQIAVGNRGDWTILTVSGEVDMATAPRLGEAGGAVEGHLLVDLSDVTFIDSSGLGELLRLARRRHRLVVVPGPPVTRLFELARVGTEFEVADSVDAVTG